MSAGPEDWLEEKAEVVEQPFRSTVPVLGPLIARFRSRWNDVATRWYVQPLLRQQNAFNRLLVERLQEMEARQITLDRDQVALAHDLAELSTALGRVERQLVALSQRLEQLEQEEQRPS